MHGSKLLGAMLLAGLVAAPVAGQVRINEVQPDNQTTITDENGDFDDWIELHNLGASPVDVSGYGVSDRLATPLAWTIPAGTSIGAGAFLLLWADDDAQDGPLHTSFKIDKDGETIVLADPAGTVLDTVGPVPVAPDESLGRLPDSSGDPLLLVNPTPAAPNVGPSSVPPVAPPAFSIPGGFFTSDLVLELSHPDPSVETRYTLDGSEPGLASTLYTGALDIVSRAGEPNALSLIWTGDSRWRAPSGEVYKAPIVRARSFKPGTPSSEVVTHTYFIGPDAETRYDGLFVVSLASDEANFYDYDTGIYVPGRVYDEEWDPGTGDPTRTPGNYSRHGIAWERPLHVEVFDAIGAPVLAQDAGVRIHGGLTRGYPQKSLRLYARSEYGDGDFDHEFFGPGGLDEFDRLILRNGGQGFYGWRFPDVLFHNLVAADAPLDIMEASNAIVFFNGIYWGLHTIREQLGQHYIERHYGIDEADIVILTRDYVLEHGNPGDEQHWNNMIAFMEANDLSDPVHVATVETLLDMESLLHFTAVGVISGKDDTVPHTSNELHWRKRTAGYVPGAPPGEDGRWRWMLKDLDRGFIAGISGNTLVTEFNFWPPYVELKASQRFRDDLANLVADYLNASLSTASVLAEIDRLTAEFDPYLNEHKARWGWPTHRPYWDLRTETARSHARTRPDIVRAQIALEFGLSGTFELSLDLANADSGSVFISTLDLSDAGNSWTGTYFQNVPVQLIAVPDPGQHFLGWADVGDSAGLQLDIQTNADVALAPQFGLAARWHVNELYTTDDPTLQYIELHTPYHRNPTYAGAVLDCGNGLTASLDTDLPSDETRDRYILIATEQAANLAFIPSPDFLLPEGCLNPAGGTLTLDGLEIAIYGPLPTDGLAVDALGTSVQPTPKNFGGVKMLPSAGLPALVLLFVGLATLGGRVLQRRAAGLPRTRPDASAA